MSSVTLENKRKRIKESFQLMDTDADGWLDYHETKAALKALGLAVNKSYVLSVLRMYDKHGDNKICFADFNYVALEQLKKQSLSDEVRYVFKLFTKESLHNSITWEDLQRVNQNVDCNLTIEEIKLMIAEFDLDQDGSSKEII